MPTAPSQSLPAWATDGAYSAPGEPWNGQPRVNSSGLSAFAAAGLTPELPTNAEQLNAWLALAREHIEYRYRTPVVTLFGHGMDFAVTIGAGVTTLTADMHAETLVVQSGGELRTNGYRVFARTSITVDVGGIISCDGNPGGLPSGATAGTAGAARAAGTLAATVAGGPGGAVGVAGVQGPGVTYALGREGGDGGTRSGNAGGTGGIVVAPTVANGGSATVPLAGGQAMNRLGHLLQAINGRALDGTLFTGGAGGGGGGGDAATQGGGGGGAGGGVMSLWAPMIANNGIIRAVGGNGAAPASGGGGGGGGGGAIIRGAVYGSITGSGTWSVAGGTGGTSGGNPSGANGTAGHFYTYEV